MEDKTWTREYAAQYAIDAHKGQKRKFTGAPYVIHLLYVADAAEKWAQESSDVLNARLFYIVGCLHAVIEDTDVTYEDLVRDFGPGRARRVQALTCPNVEGNRAARKKAYREQMSLTSTVPRVVKIFDMKHNVPDIAENDPGFAPRYIQECLAMLDTIQATAPSNYLEDVGIHEAFHVLVNETRADFTRLLIDLEDA